MLMWEKMRTANPPSRQVSVCMPVYEFVRMYVCACVHVRMYMPVRVCMCLR
jgi:hypothetical protein